MPVTAPCPSCQRPLTRSGYTLHGLRTNNPGCLAAFHKAISDELGTASESDTEEDMHSGSVHPSEPERNETVSIVAMCPYSLLMPRCRLLQVDFGWWDEADSDTLPDPIHDTDLDSDWSGSDDESSGDSDPLNAVERQLDNDEAFVLDAVAQLNVQSDEPQVDTTPGNNHSAIPNDSCRGPIVPNDRESSDVYVENFETGRAGAPVGNGAGMPSNARYQSKLNNPENPYAPFKSQTDWELALWAKTRGISSSAFTDLLNIKSVCAAPASHLYFT